KAAVTALTDLGEEALGPLRRAAREHADVDVRLRAGVLAVAIEREATRERAIYKASGWACRCAVTPDGKKVVALGDSLRVFDAGTGKELLRTAKGTFAWGLSVSRDGKYALSSHVDRVVRLHDLGTGKEVQRFDRHTGEVWLAALSPDGKE